MLPILPIFALLVSSHPLLNVPFYIMNSNGTLNQSFNTSGGLTGFLTSTNNDVGGFLGWATALIPFIILLLGLGYAMQDVFPAGMVASIVAAVICVIGTGIGTAAAPFIGNTELFVFIALTLIFTGITFAKGILAPYQ